MSKMYVTRAEREARLAAEEEAKAEAERREHAERAEQRERLAAARGRERGRGEAAAIPVRRRAVKRDGRTPGDLAAAEHEVSEHEEGDQAVPA